MVRPEAQGASGRLEGRAAFASAVTERLHAPQKRCAHRAFFRHADSESASLRQGSAHDLAAQVGHDTREDGKRSGEKCVQAAEFIGSHRSRSSANWLSAKARSRASFASPLSQSGGGLRYPELSGSSRALRTDDGSRSTASATASRVGQSAVIRSVASLKSMSTSSLTVVGAVHSFVDSARKMAFARTNVGSVREERQGASVRSPIVVSYKADKRRNKRWHASSS